MKKLLCMLFNLYCVGVRVKTVSPENCDRCKYKNDPEIKAVPVWGLCKECKKELGEI